MFSNRYGARIFGGKISLPSELSGHLKGFLDSDPCTRWNTQRDGEDIVELILEVTAYAQQYSVPMEVIAQDLFRVSKLTPLSHSCKLIVFLEKGIGKT